MPHLIVCSNCSTKLSAPDAAVGKRVKCPKCAAAVPVPAPAPADVEDEPPPARVEEPAGDEDERPRQKRRRADEDDGDERPRRKARSARDDDSDDDRPRRKKQASKGGGALVAAVIGGVLLLAGAGFAAYWFGFRDKEPETAGPGPSDPKPGTPDPKPDPKTPNPPGEGKLLTGDWKEHGDDARGFRVSLPWATATQDQAFGWGVGGSPSVPGVERATILFAHKYGTGTGNDRITARFALVALHYRPDATQPQRRAATDRAAEVDVIAFGLKAGDPNQLFWDGIPTRETRYTAPPVNGKARRAVVRKLETDALGFVGVVLDRGELTPDEIDQFYNSLKRTRYAQPVDPTRPKGPPPAGWVTHYDFVRRFTVHVPSRGQVTVERGRLARTEELGENTVVAGNYWEYRHPERGLTVSVRALQFDPATSAETRAEALHKYFDLIAEPGRTNLARTDVKWNGMDGFEESSDVAGTKQVRRAAVDKALGVVVTLRGTDPKEFDAVKGPLLDQFQTNGTINAGTRLLRKGWQPLRMREAKFYVEMPTPIKKTDELDKVLTAAKLTGEFHTSASGGITLHAGHITYAAGSTPDERRTAREELVKALSRSALPLPAVANVPIADKRVRQEYRRRGTATEPGFIVHIYEREGGTQVLAAHGVGVFSAPEQTYFFGFCEPLY